MPAKSDLPQGTLDLLILKVVALGPVHGYAIAQRLQQVSRDVVQVPQGSLYPALHRLENRGLLAADWKETETGREAKFYRLTRKGRAQLESRSRQLAATDGSRRPHPRAVRRRRAMTWWHRLSRRSKLEEQLDQGDALPSGPARGRSDRAADTIPRKPAGRPGWRWAVRSR